MNKLTRIVVTVALALSAAAACAARPIVLLRSDTTEAFFRGNGGQYELVLSPWRAFFARAHLAAREMRATELASVSEPGVLILPSTVALADEERAAIRARLAAGWSVLGTWALGVRDGQAQWSGYGFIDELFGAAVVAQAPGGDEHFLLPYGETPITSRLTAGKRIYLLPTPEPLLRVRTRNGAARYGNWMRETSPADTLLPGVAFDERDGARRAYLGFIETTWAGAQADIDKLLLGTLDWLAGRPLLVKAAWPYPYQAALLIEMDTEDKFENSLRFATQLERYGLRGTFYSVTSEAARFPSVVKRLASRHEIAYHADVHDGFAKLAPARQDARLKAMIKQMSKLLPDVRAASGFRAPLELYDDTTEQLLRANGLRHHAASPDARDDSLPGFSRAEKAVPPERALVVLPRTWLDDMNLLRSGKLHADGAENMLGTSLEDTLASRGFGLLSLHTQSFYAGSPLERAMMPFLAAVAKERARLWTASGEAFTRWWRSREAVSVATTEEAGGLRIALDVAQPVRGLQLIVIPPNAATPQLMANGTSARLERLDAYRWAIVLPELAPCAATLEVKFYVGGARHQRRSGATISPPS
ncbi:MAG TPA: polysaccharide deacetylase family protein [Burkholderiales bacterium]|nr:polysaccharide deacetylase family protein [Burkholderiales bacterium]